MRSTTLSSAVLLLVLAPAYAGSDSSPSTRHSTSATFRAGFEAATRLSGAYVTSADIWSEALRGQDGETGFTWPGAAYANFAYLVEGTEDIASIVETRIEDVTGHGGQPTRALYQAVLQDHQSTAMGRARNMYSIRNTRADFLGEGAVRYWLKLQPDLQEVLPAGSWRQVLELREEGDRYRKAVMIKPDTVTGELLWRVHGDYGPVWITDWAVDNRTIPVPLGEWMLLEMYWKEGSGSDGRLLVRINCQTVADHVGRTRYQKPISYLQLFKVYAAPASLALGPSYQWIDDVEMGSTLPSASCP